jgi:transposase
MDRTPRELLNDVLQRTTVQQVADRLGVHNVTVYRWIAGTREIVDYRHVDALRSLSGEAERESA